MYSKGTGNYILSGFSDSNIAGDTDDRNSTSSMYFYLNENLITWVSQKKCVALLFVNLNLWQPPPAACQLRSFVKKFVKEYMLVQVRC